jgi:hypothetical protein
MSRRPFTTKELRELSHGRGSQFLIDDAKTALGYCADVMDAANALIAEQSAALTRKDALLRQAMEALKLYDAAGYGNSTDQYKQGQAYDASIGVIAAIRAELKE